MEGRRTFTADKIRTSEICGINGEGVEICGLGSGSLITGFGLTISGGGESLVHAHSGIFDSLTGTTGNFDELYVNGMNVLAQNHIAYAFRFGGPPVPVPTRLPLTTSVVSEGDIYWNNVKLLIQSEAADGTQTFTDSSNSNHTITATGDVNHSITESHFGNSSIHFDGNGDFQLISDSTDWDFEDDDFTIEFWFKGTATTTSSDCIVSLGDPSQYGYGSIYLAVGSVWPGPGEGNLAIWMSSTGSSWDIADGAHAQGYTAGLMGAFSTTSWTHFAVTRSGTTFRTFAGGVIQDTWTSSLPLVDPNHLAIGAGLFSVPAGIPSPVADLDGYLEEIRITRDVARYTADFTVPDAPFSTNAPHSFSSPFVSDSNVLFLLQSPSATVSGSTSFADSSSYFHAVEAHGGVQHTTSGAKYDDSSIQFGKNLWPNDTKDYLSVSSGESLNFGTGDFTIEAWVYGQSNQYPDWGPETNHSDYDSGGLFSAANSVSNASNNWGIVHRSESGGDQGGLIFWDSINGYSAAHISLTGFQGEDNWQHVAFVRLSGVVYGYHNGTFKGSGEATGVYNPNPDGVVMGRFYTDLDNYYSRFLIEDLRVSDVARYSGEFQVSGGAEGLSRADNYTGLASGTNLVFVEDSDSFATGDHIIIEPGGLYSDGALEEQHTVTGIEYHLPNNCCNSLISYNASSGASVFYHYNTDQDIGYNFNQGDRVRIDTDSTQYTVVSDTYNSSTTNALRLNTTLNVDVTGDSSCICLVQPTLIIEDNLTKDHLTGSIVSNRHSKTIYSTPTYGDTNWVDVRLLVQSTGYLDGATEMDDSSLYSTPLTGYGEVLHSITSSKFGETAIAFDGGNDEIRMNHNDLFIDDNVSTWECWFNTSVSGFQYLACANSNQHYYGLYINPNDNTIGWGGNSPVAPGGDSEISSQGVTIKTGEWYHAAFSKGGGSAELFLNGVLVASTTEFYPAAMYFNSTHPQYNSQYITIGSQHYAGYANDGTGSNNEDRPYWYYEFNGYMDQIRFTSQKRYSSEPWDLSTVLLLESNTENGVTSFVDLSTASNTITVYGDTKHSTEESKFGNSSIYFDGAGDYLTAGDYDSANWKFGGDEFTIEAWIRPTDVYGTIMGKWETAGQSNNSFLIYRDVSSNKLIAWVQTDCSATDTGTVLTSLSNINTDEWYHIVLQRDNINNKIELYINGGMEANANISADVCESTLPLMIGDFYPPVTNVQSPQEYRGYIDSVRITKGVARYRGDFDIPTSAFLTQESPQGFTIPKNPFYTFSTSDRCNSACYDTQYLYLEKGHGSGVFDWHLTGYREYFIDVSGVDVNITGQGTSGVLMLSYPE